ncbi:hypothetical protein, partial [Vibrio jasicida]|uniref:hypothetical protein n=1 Tax=Vibrio jasicida TaxID=766224 RepID=UPI00391D42B4
VRQDPRDTPIPFWDSGILGFWDSGILGFWDSGILGFWDSGKDGCSDMQHCQANKCQKNTLNHNLC